MGNNPSKPLTYSTVGEYFSMAELQMMYGIPSDEAQSFRPLARIYPKDSVLIREGDADKTLYLIRGGTVGVYRNVANTEEQISTIEAVNFVGEMSGIIGVPRSATVRALTDTVLVYALSTPNLSLIISNPKWADLLITRFTRDLYQSNNQMVASSTRNHELTAELELVKREAMDDKETLVKMLLDLQKLMDIVLILMRAVRDQAVMGSKGWYFVMVASEAVERFAKRLFPMLTFTEIRTNIDEIHADLDAAQKGERRQNVASVYKEIQNSLKR